MSFGLNQLFLNIFLWIWFSEPKPRTKDCFEFCFCIVFLHIVLLLFQLFIIFIPQFSYPLFFFNFYFFSFPVIIRLDHLPLLCDFPDFILILFPTIDVPARQSQSSPATLRMHASSWFVYISCACWNKKKKTIRTRRASQDVILSKSTDSLSPPFRRSVTLRFKLVFSFFVQFQVSSCFRLTC